MPSDLQNSPVGIVALRTALEDQIKRRMRRWFKRNTVIAFDAWIASGKTVFDFDTVLGQLNVAHDEEALNLLDLLSRLQAQTIALDLDIYVDSVNGSDVTGDGSAENPLASFVAAQRICPNFVNSKINIFVKTRDGLVSNPITDIQSWYLDIGTDGQVTVQGIDDPVLINGPHTVSAWTDIGAAMEYGHSIQVAVPIWAAQAHVGQFIHVLTGAQAGAFYAIGENTTDILYIANTYYKMAPGDTFEIVEPGTEFYLSPDPYNSRKISINDRNNIYPAENQRFGMFGLKFNSPSILEFELFETKITLAFLNLGTATLQGVHGTINHYDMAYPEEILQAKLRLNDYPYLYIGNVTNYAPGFLLYRTTSEDVINISAEIYLLDSGIRTFRHQRCSAFLNRIFFFSGSFYGEVADQLNIILPSEIQIDGIWVNPATLTNLINWPAGSRVYLKNIEGNPATNYTVILGPGTIMSFDGVLPAGGVNDVQWSTTGAAAAFPAVAGTSITDGNGAYCVKLS